MNDSYAYNGHGSASGGTEADLGAILRSIWDGRLWLVLPGLILAGLIFLLMSFSTPEFRSEAQILVEIRENSLTRPVDDAAAAAGDSQSLLDEAAIRSQVELLRSRDLAIAVAQKLNLAEVEEFDSLIGGQSLPSRLLVLGGFKQDPQRMSVEERVIESFQDRLDVFQVEQTRVITVRFESEDPARAAEVVNTVVDEYLLLQRDAKQSSTREAFSWLSQQIDELRIKVSDAESKVAAFRADSGLLIGINNTTLSAQQLSELNSQLILAQAQRSEAQARAQSIRTMLRSGADLDGESDVLQSQLIGRLQERLINLRAERAELLSTLLPRHPRIVEIDAEISGLRGQIRAEVQKIVRSLESEAAVAGAREASIRANLEGVKSEVSDRSEDEVQLRALEREAKAQRDLLETLLARFREASAREDPNAVPADARIIARPNVSNTPATPQKGVIALALFIVSALVAAGVLFMRGLMSQVAVVHAQRSQATQSVDSHHHEYTERESAYADTRWPEDAPVEAEAGVQDEPDYERELRELAAADNAVRAAAPAAPPVVAHAVAATPKPAPASPIERQTDHPDADTLAAALRRTAAPYGLRGPEVAPGATAEPERLPEPDDLPFIVHDGHALKSAVVKRMGMGDRVSLVTTPREDGVSPTIALALARGLADDGIKVVFVDATFAGGNGRPGLGAVLEERVGFADIIGRDSESAAHIIAPDRPLSDPILLTGSDRMGTALEALAQTYEAVIVAGGPVNTSPAGRHMARRAGLVVLLALDGLAEPASLRARSNLTEAGHSSVIAYVPGSVAGTGRSAA